MTQCQQIFSVDNFIISLTQFPIYDILSGLAGGVCLRPCGPTLPEKNSCGLAPFIAARVYLQPGGLDTRSGDNRTDYSLSYPS